MQLENKIAQSKEQIILNQENILIFEEQLENDIPMASVRKNITDTQDKIKDLEHNVSIREKELKEGFLRDINTGEVLQKEK